MSIRPQAFLSVVVIAALAACATQPPPMHVPTEAEQRACEAQGGTIEPAFALNEYVCLLPETSTP